MASSERLEPGRRRAAFTLFEVLAAVAVLAILYTVLADAAIGGLRAEGEAERLLRASLIADRALAEIEEGFATGAPAPVGRIEKEEQEFAVEVEVEPFDLGALLTPLLPKAATGAEGAQPRELVLLSPQQGGTAPLLQISVRVSWTEGAFEREILRSSFAFDIEAVRPILEELPAAADQPGTEGTPDTEGQPATQRAPDAESESDVSRPPDPSQREGL